MAGWICRGKRLDTGAWVEGYVLTDTAPCTLKDEGKCECKHDGSEVYILAWNDDLHEYEQYQVDPSTVGRYIGALDVRGRKVYEGDRVRLYHIPQHCVYGEYAEGVIAWDDEQMRFALKMEDGRFYSLRSWACYSVNGNLWEDLKKEA